jgi:FKBP-type peptidyl-prolyl cis-trans isomerase FkpA
MSNVTAVPLQPVKRSYLVYIWVAVALALVSAYALARQGDPALVRESRGLGIVTTGTGLKYKVLAPGGGGAHPTDADVALVNYQGRLLDGTTFDKSERPTPLPVAGMVPGFSEALKLMPKGGKYRFWLPPALGYGAKATGPIPANSTLVFDVELVDFLPEQVIRQMQMQQQMMGGQGAPGAAQPQPGAPQPGTR